MRSTDAESIAVSGLTFIAGDPELLQRFLNLTGIEAAGIRQAAAEPGFLAGVLHFIAQHEPTLLAFASESGTPPADVTRAMRSLPLGAEDHSWQP